jgi:hypothetical protein
MADVLLDPSLLKAFDGNVGNLHPGLGNYRQCQKVVAKVNRAAMPLGTSIEGKGLISHMRPAP